MEYLYSLTVALFLTITLIPMLKRFSAVLGLVDEPGEARKIHTVAMPRTGGLGIIIGVALPITFFLPFEGYLKYLFFGSAIIVIFGLLDDRLELGYKHKLFGQALAAILVMSGGVVITQFPFFGIEDAPVWLSYPFTFFFLVGVVNGVNFSDGLDGLAAGTSIMALLLIFLLALQAENVEIALISLTIVGGLLGFLRYNTFPANIFMGDAGSQFLGFIIACLAICVTQGDQSPFSPLLPVLILGIPIMDILQVVPVRVHKNLPLPGPDKEHFHHQLGKVGFRHIEVVVIIYLLQTVLMSGGFWLRYEPDWAITVFYMAFISVVLGGLLYANAVNWQFRYKVRNRVGAERRNKYLRRINWYYYSSARLQAIILGFFFMLVGFYLRGQENWLTDIFLIFPLSFFLSLLISRLDISATIFRILLYGTSVVLAYLVVDAELPVTAEYYLNGYLLFMLISLVLAIRMTRKQEFSLTTQDLLILLVVLLIPLLPFDALSRYAVGYMALMVAVLMYSCEFVLNRTTRMVAVSSAGAITALSLLFFSGF